MGKYGEGGGTSTTAGSPEEIAAALGIPITMLVDAQGNPTPLYLQIVRNMGGKVSSLPNPTADALGKIYSSLPYDLQQNGQQVDSTHYVDPTTGSVYVYEPKEGVPTWRALSDADSKKFLSSVGVDTSPSGPGSGTGLQQTLATIAENARQFDLSFQQSADQFNQKQAEDKRQFDATFLQNIKSDADKLGLNYAQLNAQERSDLRNLAYQYYNSTNDANASRQQALATLIANKNSTAVNLAQTSADIAKTGAEFTAHPYDAMADISYRNVVSGNQAYGSTSGTNAGPFQAHQDALAAKEQELFGGVQGDLSRVRSYLDAPLPSEYMTPIQAPQINMTPQASGPPPAPANDPWAGMAGHSNEELAAYFGGGQQQAPQPEDPWAAFRGRSPEEIAQFNQAYGSHASGGGAKVQQKSERMTEHHHIIKESPDGTREEKRIQKSKPFEPKDKMPPQVGDIRQQMSQSRTGGYAAGGQSQVLPEPVALVGQSGQIYGTAAENGPEGVRANGQGFSFQPLPGVSQQLSPIRQQQIVSEVRAAPRMPQMTAQPVGMPRRVHQNTGLSARGGYMNGYSIPGFSAGGDLLKAYAAYHPEDTGAQWKAAAAGYADAAPSSSRAYTAPAVTQSDPNNGGDYRYGASQGTFNQNAGVVPLGNGSIIADSHGGSGVANPDSTFQNMYSYVDRDPNSATYGHTVTRPVTDADRQTLRDGTAAYYIGRSSDPNAASSQWLGQMADYGTNLRNHPTNTGYREIQTPSGSMGTVPWGQEQHGSTETGNIIVGWNADHSPIYGSKNPNGPGFLTPASQWASGQGDASTPHYGAYGGVGHNEQGVYGTGVTGRTASGAPIPITPSAVAPNKSKNTTSQLPSSITQGTFAGTVATPAETKALGSADTSTTTNKATALTQQIAARLAAIDPQLAPKSDQVLPDARLLASPLVLAELQNDQDLMDLVLAAYGSLANGGITKNALQAIIQKFTMKGPSNWQGPVTG